MKALLIAIGFVILAIIIYMYMMKSSPETTPVEPPTIPSPLPDLTDDPIIDPIDNPVVVPTPIPTPTPISTPTPTPVVTALSNYRKVIDSDMNVNDIAGASFIANSEEACASACNSLAECAMFAYTDGGVCYPKRTVADPSGNLAIKKGDGTYNVMNLKDFYGFDIKSYANITQNQCKQYCDNTQDCAMYRFNNGSCWLKSPASNSSVDMYYRKN